MKCMCYEAILFIYGIIRFKLAALSCFETNLFK